VMNQVKASITAVGNPTVTMMIKMNVVTGPELSVGPSAGTDAPDLHDPSVLPDTST
jgi:hypothetical protein